MKKIRCFSIFIILSFLLGSCSNEVEKIENHPEEANENPVIFKYKEQEFKIYSYYQEFEDFLESAKKQPDKLEELYAQSIIKPVSSDLGLHHINNNWMLTAPRDLETMDELMMELMVKKTIINELIVEALKDSSKQLPGGNKSIYVLPYTPESKSMMKTENSVSGEAWNKDTMLIIIDPSFLDKDLKHVIAHEYNHLVAMENNKAETLLEGIILEGKADTFAKTIYPNVDTPWIKPLTGYYKEESWKIFKENIDSVDSEIWTDFLYGNRGKGILPWTNYKIGYEIMEGFLKENPDVSINDWTKMSAEEILLKSKLLEDVE